MGWIREAEENWDHQKLKGNCSKLEHGKIKSKGVDEYYRGYHQSDRQEYNMEGNTRTKIPITGDTNSPTDATVAAASVLVLAAQVASGVWNLVMVSAVTFPTHTKQWTNQSTHQNFVARQRVQSVLLQWSVKER